MRRIIALVVPWLFADYGGASSGNSACPCLTDFPQAWKDRWVNTGPCSSGQFVPASLTTVGGSASQGECYDLNYGLGSCSAHDASLAPFCNVASPPSFCAASWCYVSSTNCNFQIARTESIRQQADSGVPAADVVYYSYETCDPGAEDTFAKYQRAALLTAAEIVGVVRGYVEDLRDYVEAQYAMTATVDAGGGVQVCEPELSCECSNCAPGSGGWCSVTDSSTCYNIDPTAMTVSHTLSKTEGFTSLENAANCLALQLQGEYRRIARREWDLPERMGNIYFGDQRSGAYFNYPGLGSSMCGFEPRFRRWYASAVSGPKDVVIILDRSGSMTKNSRWTLARQAVFSVLNTLTEFDFVSVVTFNNGADAYQGTMTRATAANVEDIRTWLEMKHPVGSTNFQAGFERAFQIVDASYSSSERSTQCNGVVLFLTDGVDTSDMPVSRVAELNLEYNFAVFTYTFGSGADRAKPKAIACANDGIHYDVEDGGDIGNSMSDYFRYYASALASNKQIRWSSYSDITTGNELIVGCLSVYNRTGSAKLLLGVQCMDVSLIISVDNFRGKPDYSSAWTAMQADSSVCYRASLTNAEKEHVRLLSGGCEAQCDVSEACGGSNANAATGIVPSFAAVMGAAMMAATAWM